MAKLIVALDVDSFAQARGLVERLDGLDVWFKVGNEAFYSFGAELVAYLEDGGRPYFLDAKLHDIPRTVAAGVRALVRPQARIVSVHAIGGNEMMQAAVEAAAERAGELGVSVPEIYAVTILTSIASEELRELGLTGGPGENVTRLAALARDARCAGVVCSVHEARDLKSFFGTEFGALCPGIRPSGTAHGDQKRVASPRDAVAAGADYLVVGRPITEASDPAAAANAILVEMSGVHV
ncbi:MAG: orotidine-5'-phosphate decarboxylase [Vulcanimicrobiaceae bacterium]